jgi:hypothetical protein
MRDPCNHAVSACLKPLVVFSCASETLGLPHYLTVLARNQPPPPELENSYVPSPQAHSWLRRRPSQVPRANEAILRYMIGPDDMQER